MILTDRPIYLIDGSLMGTISPDGSLDFSRIANYYFEIEKIFREIIKRSKREAEVFKINLQGVRKHHFKRISSIPYSLFDESFITLPLSERLPIDVSIFPFFYIFLDLTPRIQDPISVLDANLGVAFYGVRIGKDALYLPNITEIFSFILKRRAPIYVDIKTEMELKRLLQIITTVESQERYFDIPVIIGHCAYSTSPLLIGTLAKSNIYGDISGLDIDVLETIVHKLKKTLSELGAYKSWSDKLIFGTYYPYTPPELVAKQLTYFFTKRADASIEDLRKIFGINALKIIEPEVSFGKMINLEVEKEEVDVVKLLDKLKYYIMRGSILLKHIELFADSEDFSEGVIEIISPTTGQQEAFMLTKKYLVSLPAQEIRKLYERKKESFLKIIELKEALESEEKTKELLEKNLKKIGIETEQLYFYILFNDMLEDFALMNKTDLAFLGLKDNEVALISLFNDGSHAIKVRSGDVRLGVIEIPIKYQEIWPHAEWAIIRRFEGRLLQKLERVVLGAKKIHLEPFKEIIKNALKNIYVTRNEQLNIQIEQNRFDLRVLETDPYLRPGEYGMIGIDTILELKTVEMFPINLVLLLDTSADMESGQVIISGSFKDTIPRIDTRIDTILEKETLSLKEAAAILGIRLIEYLLNKLEIDKIALINYSLDPKAFSVLEEGEVREFLEYGGPMKDFALDITGAFVIDSYTLPSGKPNLIKALRKMMEIVDKFQDDNRVIAIIIGSGKINDINERVELSSRTILYGISFKGDDYTSLLPPERVIKITKLDDEIINLIYDKLRLIV